MTDRQPPPRTAVGMSGADPQWRAAQRVLVVRLDNLGDVLVTTPAIHAVRESLPNGSITLLASPVGAQAGRLNPDIDDVIVYQAPWMDPWHELPLEPEREQAMVRTLTAGQFDAAIIFTSFRQSPLPAAYLCYLAGIPLRAAASIDGPGSLLTTRHKHPERMMHEVERGLDLVGALGMTTSERDLVLDVPDIVRHEATRALRERAVDLDRPLIVVHPGCSMPARTYPWELFASVIELLVERFSANVVLTGVQSEAELAARIMARVTPAAQQSLYSVAGVLPFPAFCALIEMASLTITNNTGPMHIAAATKTPVIALFALTNPPEQWGPWKVPHQLLYHDVSCRICYARICPYGHECLTLVTPAMVADAAAGLLTTAPARRSTALVDAGGAA
jgi:ADP-heptose:LPS heptosyltransferase